MLWIFVLALIMPISLGSCDDTNLAKVTWAHAVNSQAELKDTLGDDKIQMIEADVILGTHEVPAPEEETSDEDKSTEDKSTEEEIESDAESEGTEPEGTKPANNKPANNKPADNKPVDPKPEEDKEGIAPKSGDKKKDEGKKEGDDKKDGGDNKKDGGDKKKNDKTDATAKPAGASKPGKGNKVPIMGHPPADKSDLSLKEFLAGVTAHNKDSKEPKGVKLDFKCIKALKGSLGSIKPKDLKADLWINADIITGPGKKDGDEVNAKEFFAAVHSSADLKNKTLSIGWTTELPGKGKDKVKYTKDHIDAMVKAIEDSKIPVGYPITFPVRAAIVAESKDTLHSLYDKVSKDRQVTFTIWSGKDDTDQVDEVKLQDFINSFGVSKVYVDVPTDLGKKLNLSGGASTIIKFGLLNLAAIAFAMFFRNGLH